MAENWADFHRELLELCSQRLLLEDWFAFRAVCSAWRAAAFKERISVPWLMLADGKRTETERSEFFSLFSSRIHTILLPEVKAKRCFSSRGWILTIGTDLQVHMLNPLSRAASRYRDDIIKLPSVDKLPGWDPEGYEPDHMYADFVCKFVLSASPASSPNYTVMVIYWHNGQLGFWKPGNEGWKKLTRPYFAGKELTWSFFAVLDVIHYKGQFVAVNSGGSIVRCDVDGADPTVQLILEMPRQIRRKVDLIQLYLVESAGNLLLVSRSGQQDGGTDGFWVFAVDLEAKKWTELQSLGKASLFVGFNSSFSVQVDENRGARGLIKPDCIYFTDDCSLMYRDTEDGGGKDMGIYHMKDGRIESFFDGESYDHFSPPLWIETSS